MRRGCWRKLWRRQAEKMQESHARFIQRDKFHTRIRKTERKGRRKEEEGSVGGGEGGGRVGGEGELMLRPCRMLKARTRQDTPKPIIS